MDHFAFILLQLLTQLLDVTVFGVKVFGREVTFGCYRCADAIILVHILLTPFQPLTSRLKWNCRMADGRRFEELFVAEWIQALIVGAALYILPGWKPSALNLHRPSYRSNPWE